MAKKTGCLIGNPGNLCYKVMELKELKDKILEALYSALPITVLVYLMALTPWFEFSTVELITFTVGAVLLVLGIGLFSMGADDQQIINFM